METARPVKGDVEVTVQLTRTFIEDLPDEQSERTAQVQSPVFRAL